MSSENVNKLTSLIFASKRLIFEHIRKNKINPLSFLRLETLRYVAENPNLSMKEVARYLGITPPSATSLVNDLVKSGLLRRKADKRDRRVVHLIVTPVGKVNLAKGLTQISLQMKKILTKLDEKEIVNLIKIHEKLSKLLINK